MHRIRELDGLRAILAFWVLLVHVSKSVYDVHELPASTLIYNEATRVRVFFMISGMVVFGMLNRRHFNYREYILGRLKRIVPAFFVALGLSVIILPIAIEAVKGNPFPAPQNEQRAFIFAATAQHFWAHLAAHLTMLHGIVPTTLLPHAETAIIGQAWNISTEFQFYLIAPLLLWLFSQRSAVRYAAIFLFGAVVIVGKYYPNNANFGLSAPYFALGIATFFILENSGRLFRSSFAKKTGIAALLAIAAISAWFELAISIWALFMLLVMPHYLGMTTARPLRALASPPMLLLGRLSYSLYLSHMVVLYPMMWLLNDDGWGRTAYFIILLGSTAAGATLLAYLIHKYVEAPMSRLQIATGGEKAIAG